MNKLAIGLCLVMLECASVSAAGTGTGIIHFSGQIVNKLCPAQIEPATAQNSRRLVTSGATLYVNLDSKSCRGPSLGMTARLEANPNDVGQRVIQRKSGIVTITYE